MSRQLSFFYDVLLEFDQAVRGHAFALRCVPPGFPGQDILDVTLVLDPQAPYARQHDGFGNLLQIGRVEDWHDHFRYTVRGTARLDGTKRKVETLQPVFRFPSAYTAVNRDMETYLDALELPDGTLDKAWALSEAVREKMAYRPGVTGVATTAAEAFAAGSGVCQDFAHVFLALARRAGLAARYVNGLTEGEGASHAWCEVWADGVWTGVDPTRGRWAGDGYIRLGVGRDFGDCPIERGVFLGWAGQTQTVWSQVKRQ